MHLTILAGGAVFAAATAIHAAGTGLELSSLPQGVAVAWQAHLLGAACGVPAGLSATAAINASHT